MSVNWNQYFARYQLSRGGAYFGTVRERVDCQLVLTEGERAPILVFVDTIPAGRSYNTGIFARTCVQLDREYRLKIGPANAVVGGFKGLVKMVGGGDCYGCPEITGNRSLSTNDDPFTAKVLGDPALRELLAGRKRDHLKVRPTPQGEGWHMIEVGDINFEGLMAGSSPWVNELMETDTVYMQSEDKQRVEEAAQDYFNTQMDEFLTFLRTAARAVTAWRM